MWSPFIPVLFAAFGVAITFAQPYPSGSGQYNGEYFEVQNWGSSKLQNGVVPVANDYFGVDPNSFEAKLVPAASFQNNYSSFDNYFYEYYPYGNNGSQYGSYHGGLKATWRPVFESCRYPFFSEVTTASIFDLYKIIFSETDPSGLGPVFFGFNCSDGTNCQQTNRTVYVYDQNGTTYTSWRDADNHEPKAPDNSSYWYVMPNPVDDRPVPPEPAYSMSFNWYQNTRNGGVGNPSLYTLGTQSCACSSGGCTRNSMPLTSSSASISSSSASTRSSFPNSTSSNSSSSMSLGSSSQVTTPSNYSLPTSAPLPSPEHSFPTSTFSSNSSSTNASSAISASNSTISSTSRAGHRGTRVLAVNPSTYTYTITTHSTSIFTTSGHATTSVRGTTYTTAFDSSQASSWSSKVIMVSTRQASHVASLASIRSSKTLAASVSRVSARLAASNSHDSARSKVAVSKSLASVSRQSARSVVSVSKSLASVLRASSRSVFSVSKASRIASYNSAHSITIRAEPTKEETSLITAAPDPGEVL